MKLVFDTEADDLYFEATKVWCICTYCLESQEKLDYNVTDGSVERGIERLWEADELIGHNIIAYDLPLLYKLYPDLPPYQGKVFDTMIFSQLLNPERFGGHSLERAGEILGYPKKKHEDWTQYSQDMLLRCQTDVELNYKWYNYLMKEAGEQVEGVVLTNKVD